MAIRRRCMARVSLPQRFRKSVNPLHSYRRTRAVRFSSTRLLDLTDISCNIYYRLNGRRSLNVYKRSDI